MCNIKTPYTKELSVTGYKVVRVKEDGSYISPFSYMPFGLGQVRQNWIEELKEFREHIKNSEKEKYVPSRFTTNSFVIRKYSQFGNAIRENSSKQNPLFNEHMVGRTSIFESKEIALIVFEDGVNHEPGETYALLEVTIQGDLMVGDTSKVISGRVPEDGVAYAGREVVEIKQLLKKRSKDLAMLTSNMHL